MSGFSQEEAFGQQFPNLKVVGAEMEAGAFGKVTLARSGSLGEVESFLGWETESRW